MKICNKCREEKPLSDFYKSKRTKDGYKTVCIPCKKGYDLLHLNKETKRKYNQQRESRLKRGQTPERQEDQRNRMLKRRYGITSAQYDEMLKAQNNACFICKGINKDGRRLSVDHNHTTNQIRTLLCGNCNLIVGNCKEDPTILLQVIEYLKLFNSEAP